MLRKWLLIVLVLVLILTIFGCDGSKDNTSPLIAKMREEAYFGIARYEATDSELRAFLEDQPNRVFIEATIRQITFGRRLLTNQGISAG